MSAGNAGNQSPESSGDDPFGYLYRPEGGAEQAPQAPPSFNQVRAVGERTYGGQRHGYGYPPRQDPHYAAPETQPGGGYPGGGRAGPSGPDQDDDNPRRNTLLIGAIAVVTAVVLGVGAAILFSDGDSGDPGEVAGGDPRPGDDAPEDDPDDEADEEEDEEDEEDEEEDEEESSDELPAADPGELELTDGATLGGGYVDNARSADGSYIAELDQENATVSWIFDFDGDPGEYQLNIGYSVPDGDQQMSLAINDTLRDDKVNFKDHVGAGTLNDNWTGTWHTVQLEEGTNTVHIGCVGDDQCDVVIDKFEVTPSDVKPDWW